MHQILQWHHMLSDTAGNPTDTVAGKEANVLADGFFHTATWVFVFVGMSLTLRSWQRGRLAPSWRFQLGLLLAGWGVRSEEHTSELQSLMRNSYVVFCLKTKNKTINQEQNVN